MKHIIIQFVISILAFSILVFPLQAEIYQWKDAEGNIQFGDRPPPSARVKKIEVEINSYESVTIEPFTPFESKRSRRGGSVVMYSTSWCGFCRKARHYFRKQKIPFTEYDVETSAKGKRDYNRMNGSGVPIILVGEKRMNGFSVARFKKLYGG